MAAATQGCLGVSFSALGTGADTRREEVKRVADPSIAFVGDSITAFWQERSPSFWRANFHNFGVAGMTGRAMAAGLAPRLAAVRPDIVHILAGTNDVAGNEGEVADETVFAHVRRLVEIARSIASTVIVGSILPIDTYWWAPTVDARGRIIRINELLKTYARSPLIYMDYHRHMITAGGAPNLDMLPDGVHPEAAGYAVMEKVLMRALSR